MRATAPPTPAISGPAAERLIRAVQDLSLARDLPRVMEIVRHAARELTGADGATFVLREGDCCYYADEEAVSPLWKGSRFPMSACVSGWVMRNARSVAIEDIYADPRVPADAYRATFVKSMVMVPVREQQPVGAIGNYWASRHAATAEELRLLEALANSASVAMENVQLYASLEQRIRERTAELEAANRELEAFAYSVSHDLRAPLRAIDGFSTALREHAEAMLGDRGIHFLDRIQSASGRMAQLIEDLLKLSRVTTADMHREPVDLSIMVAGILGELQAGTPQRSVETHVTPGLAALADSRLVRIALDNLLANAWKYTSRTSAARIEFSRADGSGEFVVRDNGAGFDMQHAGRLFGAFQRMHSPAEFPGTGVGLAIVQRIVHRHGGHIRAEAQPGAGATFFFTLG